MLQKAGLLYQLDEGTLFTNWIGSPWYIVVSVREGVQIWPMGVVNLIPSPNGKGFMAGLIKIMF